MINSTCCSEKSEIALDSSSYDFIGFSLQLVEFIPNFAPSHAITYTNLNDQIKN